MTTRPSRQPRRSSLTSGRTATSAVLPGLVQAEAATCGEQRGLGRVPGERAVGAGGGVVGQNAGSQQEHERRAEPVRVEGVDLRTVVRRLQDHDDHLVAGQGPGLVGADGGDGPERLDGVQVADQGVPSEHALRAQRQGDGDDRRQALRDRRDRQAHGGEDEQVEGFALQGSERCDDGDDDADEHGEPPHEGVEPLLEGGPPGRGALQQPGDPSELGAHARGGDEQCASPGGDARAGVGHGRPLGQRRADRYRCAVLVRGRRLARECGLLHPQGVRLDEPTVRRHPAAGFDPDQVAGDEVACGHRADGPVADDDRLRDRHPLQRRHRGLGPVLLPEADDRVEQDHAEDHSSLGGVAEQRGEHPRRCQQPDHRGGHLGAQDQQPPPGLLLVKPVRADLDQQRAGGAGGQPPRGRAPQAVGHEVGCFGMVPAPALAQDAVLGEGRHGTASTTRSARCSQQRCCPFTLRPARSSRRWRGRPHRARACRRGRTGGGRPSAGAGRRPGCRARARGR